MQNKQIDNARTWLKAKGIAKNQTYAFFTHSIAYLETKRAQPSLVWKEYVLKKWKNSPQNLNKVATELNDLLEAYLLDKRAEAHFYVMQKIELFYAYRELGLLEEKKEVVKEIKSLMPNIASGYIHYLYTQLDAETKVVNGKRLDYTDMDLAFNQFWISEYLYVEIVKFNANVPSENSLFDKIKAYILLDEGLRKDAVIRMYMDLYDLYKLHKGNKTAIEQFHTTHIQTIATFTLERKRDVLAMFTNLLFEFYVAAKTYENARFVRDILHEGIEKRWSYIGNKLDFMAYLNVLRATAVAYEEDEKQKITLLKDLQSKHQNNIVYGNNETAEAFIELLFAWHTKTDLQKIVDINTAKFKDESTKSVVQILQLKAAYQCYEMENDAHDFLGEMTEKIRKNQITKNKSTEGELQIWHSIYDFYTAKSTQNTHEKAALREIYENLKTTKETFPDRMWYVGLLKNVLGL